MEQVVENIRKGCREAVLRVEEWYREVVKGEFSKSVSNSVGWVRVDFEKFYNDPCVLAVMVEGEPGTTTPQHVPKIEVGLKRVEPYPPILDDLTVPGSLMLDLQAGSDTAYVYGAEIFRGVNRVLVCDRMGFEPKEVVGVTSVSVKFNSKVSRTFKASDLGGIIPSRRVDVSIPTSGRPDFAAMFVSRAVEEVSKSFTPWFRREWVCVGIPCVKCIPFTSICWWDWCTSCDWVYVPYTWLQEQIIKAIVILAWYVGVCLNTLWDREIANAYSTISRIAESIIPILDKARYGYYITLRTFVENWRSVLEKAFEEASKSVGKLEEEISEALKVMIGRVGECVANVSSDFLSKVLELAGRVGGGRITPAIIRFTEDKNGFYWWSPTIGSVIYYVVIESTEVI